MESIFKEILNQTIKPLLKSTHFKKKALNFYKNSNGLIYLINIQKSHGNSSNEFGFYVNCSIHSNIIEEALGKKVLEFPKEYQCHFNKRIEEISAKAPDKFIIKSTVNIERLKDQIKGSFEDTINFFLEITDNHSFVRLLSKSGTLKQNEVFRYCLRLNLLTEATNLVGLFEKNMDKERWEDVFKKHFIEIHEEEHSKMEIELLK